jgi:CheY-like chemotaxis protein
VAFQVLIVDDDPVFRVIVAELLSPWFTCVQMEDGDTALEYLEHNPVDLVVTDVVMPRLDGLELIRTARRGNRYVPIVAVSGGAPGLDATLLLEMAEALGVDAAASKPLNRDAFLKIVTEVLEPSAKRRAAAVHEAG